MAHREEREDTSSPAAHCAARRRHRKQRGGVSSDWISSATDLTSQEKAGPDPLHDLVCIFHRLTGRIKIPH